MTMTRFGAKICPNLILLCLLVVACNRSKLSTQPQEPVLTPIAEAPSVPTAKPETAALPATPEVPHKPQVFVVDENHTRFGFIASTLLFDVEGSFQKYGLAIQGDPANPSKHPQIRVELDASSISTGNETRDKHLQSADFFDAVKYPKVVFTADKIVPTAGGTLVVQGTLQMHGVTRPMTLECTQTVGKNGAGATEYVYKATLPIKRKDYGIGTDSIAAKISLQDTVQLKLLLAGFWKDEPTKPAR